MEEIAKAPLIQAHFLDKKAESFTKKQMFEKAIECREKAIEHLKIARQLTLGSEAINSLNNQIDVHDSRIHLLREQHRKKEAKIQNTLRLGDRQNYSFPKTSEGFLSKIDDQRLAVRTPSPLTASPEMASDIEAAIKKEILKGDKLLDSLISQQSRESSEDTDGLPLTGKSDLISSAIKLPKPVEQVVEELRLHNSQLKALVGSLFEELDNVKFENKQLKEEIVQLKTTAMRSETDNPGPKLSVSPLRSSSVAVSSSAIDLHPLEPFELPQLPVPVKPRVKVPPRTTRISE